MYTGLRFKGIVKKQFRADFKPVAMAGEWNSNPDERLLSFGKNSRSGFIPCGGLAYMPRQWETKPYDYGCGAATDGFDRTWNEDTGYWTFQCSLKEHKTIDAFLKLLPYFIESVQHCEVFYEQWDWSEKWELINDQMVMTDDKFIKYNDYKLY